MWVVTVISPWEQPREYVLKAGKTMVGRHPGNDIVIAHDGASRLHAEFDYDLNANTAMVRDMDSTNGTWVNRQRISDARLLRSNDQIHIGQHLLTLLQRDHSTSGRTARLQGTQPLAHEIVRQSIDRRAPVLYEVANRLNTIAQLPLALSEVSHLARMALAADQCQILLVVNGKLEGSLGTGFPRAFLERALAKGEALVVADLASEQGYGPVGAHIHAAVCVPGGAEDDVVCLTVAYRIGANTQAFEEFDVELAIAITHEAAQTVHQLQLLAQATVMRQLAANDRLTGRMTRRHFLGQAEPEFRRARRYKRPLAVMTIDIDNFKVINQNHGHATGDQVLIAVADMCSNHLREPHLLCRYGDDEFMVLLLECDEAGARAVAERLRDKVAARSVDSMTGPVSVAVSTGYAALTKDIPSLAALIEHAQVNRYATRSQQDAAD